MFGRQKETAPSSWAGRHGSAPAPCCFSASSPDEQGQQPTGPPAPAGSPLSASLDPGPSTYAAPGQAQQWLVPGDSEAGCLAMVKTDAGCAPAFQMSPHGSPGFSHFTSSFHS